MVLGPDIWGVTRAVISARKRGKHIVVPPRLHPRVQHPNGSRTVRILHPDDNTHQIRDELVQPLLLRDGGGDDGVERMDVDCCYCEDAEKDEEGELYER